PVRGPVGAGRRRAGRHDGHAPPRRPDARPSPPPAARVLRTGRARAPARPRPGRERARRGAGAAGDAPRPAAAGPPGRPGASPRAAPRAADARPLLAPSDHPLQVHSCHGRARQVEVVRDAILHLLADDPTLEPRDVVVMCPDIETFAPLVHATFGSAVPD